MLKLLVLTIYSTFNALVGWSQESKKSETEDPISLPKLERPRVQQRFQPREDRFSVQLSALGHIRDDYYTSWGAGFGGEYFFHQDWGVALHLSLLNTSLSDEAVLLRDRYGLVPDARPQKMMITAGALYGLGYGKLLLFGNVVHLDPLAGFHLGVTTAGTRVLPTMKVSFAPTFLLRYQLAVRLDLGVTAQLEWRERGVVFTTGFLPQIIFSWGSIFKSDAQSP